MVDLHLEHARRIKVIDLQAVIRDRIPVTKARVLLQVKAIRDRIPVTKARVLLQVKAIRDRIPVTRARVLLQVKAIRDRIPVLQLLTKERSLLVRVAFRTDLHIRDVLQVELPGKNLRVPVVSGRRDKAVSDRREQAEDLLSVSAPVQAKDLVQELPALRIWMR